jgi:hypothetical protein
MLKTLYWYQMICFKQQVYTASCSIATGSRTFNPMSGYCEMKNDYSMAVTDLFNNYYSCGAAPDTLNTLFRKCAPATACTQNCIITPSEFLI